MAELRVGTLRVAVRGAITPDPEPLLAAIAHRDTDRSVLIVRRLTLLRDDPETARDALDKARRNAVHPAYARVPVDAEAVYFADEAEALLCLSRDIIAGVSAEHWWWAERRPAYANSPGEALAVAWSRTPRWVPAVLAELEAAGSGTAAHAVATLGAAAVMVLAAVLDEFPHHRFATPPPLTEGRDALPVVGEPSAAARGRSESARRIIEVAAIVTGRAISPVPASATERGARELVGSVATLASPEMAASLEPRTPTASTPSLMHDPAAPAIDIIDTFIPADPPNPSDPSAAGLAPIADLDRERLARRGADDGLRSQLPPARPWIPTWTGGGPRIDSEIASLLFAVNLVKRFDLVAAAGVDPTGWGVVEAVGRSLLRGIQPVRRHELARDPLFELFADLDGRPHGTPTRVRLGAAMAPVRRWLARQRVPAGTFAQPGSIVVSRTHVDVVLDLQHIDMRARISGLDQDPGWMPELGRIVLFHFEGP